MRSKLRTCVLTREEVVSNLGLEEFDLEMEYKCEQTVAKEKTKDNSTLNLMNK